jgi:hypothetical protein
MDHHGLKALEEKNNIVVNNLGSQSADGNSTMSLPCFTRGFRQFLLRHPNSMYWKITDFLYVAMQTRNIHKNSLYQGGQMIS